MQGTIIIGVKIMYKLIPYKFFINVFREGVKSISGKAFQSLGILWKYKVDEIQLLVIYLEGRVQKKREGLYKCYTNTKQLQNHYTNI